MAFTLLPLFIFSALCGLATIWFIEQKEQLQWTCESQNLKAQKALIRGMTQLLSLNPIIEAIVLERRMVQIALAASPTPAEKVALTARLIMLNLQLTNLATHQKSLILSAQTIAGKELFDLRQKLQEHVKRMGREWSVSLHLHMWTSSARIKLRRQQIEPLAAIYVEHPFLSAQQKIKVDIAITGERLFPDWLKWISDKPLIWKEQCLTQPQKENLLWNARIKMDKLS